MRYTLIVLLVHLLLSTSCQKALNDNNETLDLSGPWSFQLDPDNIGVKNKWYNNSFSDAVQLPGTTDENKKGIFLDEQADDRLSRVWSWEGAAWYQKEIDVPERWTGKNVKLILERTKDVYVWFDDINCGYENTLSAPQYFDLTKVIKPGKHRITVLVDNAKLPPIGNAFAISEKTQTNWNGIVGRMELLITDPIWIDDVQVYPDVKNNVAKIRVNIGNITGKQAEGELLISAESWNTQNKTKFRIHKEIVPGISDDEAIEFTYYFDKQAPLWDEFDPALIRLNLNLSVNSDDKNFKSSKQVDFGMREFIREGKHIYINGKRVFLRGRIDCANYPLTGYAPMNKMDWLEYFKLLKSYGINHWRFHTWFPPQAALAAADEIGIYLQPELPNQNYNMDEKSCKEEDLSKMFYLEYLDLDTLKTNPALKDYLQREGELILKHFGNHPSFAMFTLGNELGRNQAMFDLVARFKNYDSRRLYAQGSNNMALTPSFPQGDDFWVTARVSGKFGIRGSFAKHLCPEELPHIEYAPPSSMHNYNGAIEEFNAPIIAHEVGQYQVSPDFNDIPKFTGVTRARNLEIFRERFKKANILDQADDFVKASGKLAVICYKEDIEAALRTPDFAGFQLLDIQDYPGQGTALVGILNDFMESKGLVTPEEWSQFCSEVVPLLLMGKYTWTNDETYVGDIEIAHYGKEDYKDAVVNWKVVDSKGNLFDEGKLASPIINRGRLNKIGAINVDLNSIERAEKLNIVVSLEGTKYKNEYSIWVYPKSIETIVPKDVMVSNALDSRTREHLLNGGKAIIFPDHAKLTHCIQGAFQTDFWCYPMFLRGAIKRGVEPAPGSLGFICNPDSPMLEHFPTEYHSNWQWWHLVKNCKPIILDETPADYKPMVQTIDNFSRNHKLGMIFETKYGKGSALICAIDLLNHQDKPEARQLYYSILKYVDSESFSPGTELNRVLLDKIIPAF
jgi:hypothetical protein